MASPDVVLELRPPALASFLYAASLVVGVVVVVVFLGTDAPPWFAVAFLAVAVGITAVNTAAALSRARARTDGTLEVRNRFTTRRVDRSEIDRVLLDSVGGFGSNRRVELLLTDGSTLPLVATETPPLPGARRRLEDQAARLQDWVGTAARY
ncbi:MULTISPECIES: hypothetical protein [unclassified Blastococcus]